MEAARAVARAYETEGAHDYLVPEPELSSGTSSDMGDGPMDDMLAQIATVTEPDVYEVEKILNMRRPKRGPREFLIRWLGFGPEHDTWEPEPNLHLFGPHMVENYLLACEGAAHTAGTAETVSINPPPNKPTTPKRTEQLRAQAEQRKAEIEQRTAEAEQRRAQAEQRKAEAEQREAEARQRKAEAEMADAEARVKHNAALRELELRERELKLQQLRSQLERQPSAATSGTASSEEPTDSVTSVSCPASSLDCSADALTSQDMVDSGNSALSRAHRMPGPNLLTPGTILFGAGRTASDSSIADDQEVHVVTGFDATYGNYVLAAEHLRHPDLVVTFPLCKSTVHKRLHVISKEEAERHCDSRLLAQMLKAAESGNTLPDRCRRRPRPRDS